MYYFTKIINGSNDVGYFSGGCCHTYIDKGYEFDVGIHYIGDVGYPTMFRVLLDQVTDGQLQWAPLEETFDYTSIGYGEENRKYPIIAGTWLKSIYPNVICLNCKRTADGFLLK